MTFMTDQTKQKIMDAALKIFAKEGYKSATIRAISLESGFTEMTIFRKFKTKKDLYDQVLLQNAEKLLNDYMGNIVLAENNCKTPQDFLENYFRIKIELMEKYFEFFNLSVNEDNAVLEPVIGGTVDVTGEYLRSMMPDLDIDHTVLGLQIDFMIYMLNLQRYQGNHLFNGKSFEETVDNFVEIIRCMVTE